MAELIREDFDRLALLDDGGWTHNNHYHPFLLQHVPEHCEAALEIGCGAGAFSRQLAERSKHVLGLDLAPEMVRIAQERSKSCPNVEYQVADVLQWDFPQEKYDCIASIATFHHLPLDEMLQKAKSALRPGGMLLILDLFKSEWPQDFLMDCAAVPASIFLRLAKTGRLRQSPEVKAAWDAHGIHDVYMPLAAIRKICEQIIPGANVQRHLMWRYSIVWKKV
jgi:2-polyprenyl-3-methyl-5-hydroxy-6-metoxy-1,4-benzoquinol methylase